MLRGGILPDRVVEELVDPIQLSRLIEDLLRAGDFVEAERRAIMAGSTWFAPMTAAGRGLITVKMVGVHPGNPRRGLPLVMAHTAVYDSSTGIPLMVYEARSATAARTAAASLLAAILLGAPRGGVLGIIGAGVQARAHGRLFQRALGPARVLVTSRTRESAERLAREEGWEPASAGEINREADIIVAATNSTEPVVRGALLRPGATVISVGAPAPVRELDEDLKERAGCVLLDTGNAVNESPDATGWRETITLDRAAREGQACRRAEIKVYKSVGRPLFDHALSLYLVRKLGLQ